MYLFVFYIWGVVRDLTDGGGIIKKCKFQPFINFFRATYICGNSANLPKVTVDTIMTFICSVPGISTSELRHRKSERSAGADYGDDAVGRVELYRAEGSCFLKAEVCPEHRVSNKTYKVTAVVREITSEVIDLSCHGCLDSASPVCKHAIVFLFWMYDRSKEKSPTEVACYWNKPNLLSSSGRYKYSRIINLRRFKPRPRKLHPLKRYKTVRPLVPVEMLVPVSTSFKNFRADKRSGFNILSFVNGDPEPNPQLCIHRLSCKFQNSVDRSLGAFINFINSTVAAGTFERMEKVTRGQYLFPVWKNLRYGRITASIVHEMAHCRTIGGSLVDRVMGSARPFDNFAMARG